LINGSITRPECFVVITFSTPSGSPASVRIGLRGRLEHHGAAGGHRGPDLAGAHRRREVPRGDQQARADRLAHDQHPGATGRGDGVVALDAHRLLGEPPEELGGVGDLAA
jgi:hypothetical protein